MASIKLTYFDIRGLAETARYLLKIGGVAFEDVRLSLTRNADGSFSRPEFDAAKAAGQFPFGQVPILEVDGVKICQSKAIERFLARHVGLLNGTEVEVAVIESACEEILDLALAYRKAAYAPEAEREALKAAFYSTELPKFAGLLENFAGAEYLVGGKLSLADVHLYAFLERLGFENAAALTATLDAHPKLKASFNKVAQHPAIVEWQAARPQTAM
eukprot:m.229020 g.229020  ORF g.229020 m.229020 type:complete len:216 (+) comp11838_c0_seq1:51-698(+)